MKGIFVTIVDVLAVFIPGTLILWGILGMPVITAELHKLNNSSLTIQSSHSNNTSDPNSATEIRTVALFAAGILAYVLGFLNRLWSIRLLQWITSNRVLNSGFLKRHGFECWKTKLQKRTKILEPIIEKQLNDTDLSGAILALAPLETNNPGHVAPYFHLAKRIIRAGPESLWAEAERLEAEVRITAGLFLPCCLFAYDAFKRTRWDAFFPPDIAAWVFYISTTAAILVVAAFPDRRVREVIFDYYLTLMVLRNERLGRKSKEANSSNTHNDNDES